MTATDPHSDRALRAVEQTARACYGRLVAWLAKRWRDVAAAEDAVSEAFATALRTWPHDGVPARPEAWILAAAHRRLIDKARHLRVRAAAAAELGAALETHASPMPFPDERLPLLFVCAHPAIKEEARAPLMLQTVLGLDAARIAAAFLVAPATMGQRLVRAKTKIREAGISFQLPEPSEWPARLDSVLEAIYAAYGSGWDDLAGADTPRGLAQEALWLARALVELLPEEPEALGLLALLLHSEARHSARRDSGGRYIPLSDQNPADWSRPLIKEAERTLLSAARLDRPARFQWLAAIQSAHARRIVDGRTDWIAITTLYQTLVQHAPTAGVLVARIAALAQTHGPAQAEDALEALLEKDATFRRYQPYWALRAHLLGQLGRGGEATEAYRQAIQLCTHPTVRTFLQERLNALSQKPGG